MRETEPLHFSLKSGGFDFHMGTVPKDNWLKTKWIASDSDSLQPNQRRLPRVNETITLRVFDSRWLFRDLGFHVFKSKNDSVRYLWIKLNIYSVIKCVLTLPYINLPRQWPRRKHGMSRVIDLRFLDIQRFLEPFLAQEKHFWWASLCANTGTKAASDFPKWGLAAGNELQIIVRSMSRKLCANIEKYLWLISIWYQFCVLWVLCSKSFSLISFICRNEKDSYRLLALVQTNAAFCICLSLRGQYQIFSLNQLLSYSHSNLSGELKR